MTPIFYRTALVAGLTLCSNNAYAIPVSIAFFGVLNEAPDPYYFFDTPTLRFEGASFELTVYGDTDTLSNYNYAHRGTSQNYDFTRFDATADLFISNGVETIETVGQAVQVAFYNFLNTSPYSDIVSFGMSAPVSSGGFASAGLNVFDQNATSIWDDDGFITSLSVLDDPGFDPNGIVRGFLSDSGDANAQYRTATLSSGLEVSQVPLPAPLFLLLCSVAGMAAAHRFGQRG